MSFDDANANQIKEHDINPQACRALWCAVIEEQLRLAMSQRAVDRPFEIDGARRWFGSRDFFAVCALAGLDGAWVLSGARRKFQKAGAA